MDAARRTGVALIALAMAGCAGTAAVTAPVAVPEPLRTNGSEVLAVVVPANGVQIYECRAVAQRPGSFEWVFVAPDAELFDARGMRVGRHYAGPYWEAADGSRIKGQVRARAEAPAADAIPWLLLDAASAGPHGAYSAVKTIQRVNTRGGAPPAGGCSSASAGRQARIAYTADYYFYTAR